MLSLAAENHWKSILYAGGIPALVDLLRTKNTDELQSLAASVLCNIGSHTEVRNEVSKADAVPVVISLLDSSVPMIHSRAAVILGDLACIDVNQTKIAEQGKTCIAKHYDIVCMHRGGLACLLYTSPSPRDA